MSIKLVENGIRDLVANSTYDYVGYILQCMNIYTSNKNGVPWAGVNYCPKSKRFNLYVNPETMGTLPHEHIKGILRHEVDHIIHRHVFRNDTKADHKTWNIAMDMVINQGNEMLPEWVIRVDKFRTKNGKAFPLNRTTDEYYALLKQDGSEVNLPKQAKGDKDEQGDGAPQQDNNKGQGKNDTEWKSVKEWLDSQERKTVDDHIFQDGEAIDKAEAEEAMRDVLRAARKRCSTYSRNAGKLDSMLKEVDANLNKLNYREVLKTAIRRSMPARNFQRTHQRINRRLGNKAAGRQIELLPKVDFLFDTSGSIGPEQINDALGVIDGFLGIISSVNVHFFHTNTYKTVKNVKRGYRVKPEDLKSGGTDLTDSFQKLIKQGSDLCLVLTDGYFGEIEVDKRKAPRTVFIIDKQGNTEHPWSKSHKTFYYDK